MHIINHKFVIYHKNKLTDCIDVIDDAFLIALTFITTLYSDNQYQNYSMSLINAHNYQSNQLI